MVGVKPWLASFSTSEVVDGDPFILEMSWKLSSELPKCVMKFTWKGKTLVSIVLLDMFPPGFETVAALVVKPAFLNYMEKVTILSEAEKELHEFKLRTREMEVSKELTGLNESDLTRRIKFTWVGNRDKVFRVYVPDVGSVHESKVTCKLVYKLCYGVLESALPFPAGHFVNMPLYRTIPKGAVEYSAPPEGYEIESLSPKVAELPSTLAGGDAEDAESSKVVETRFMRRSIVMVPVAGTEEGAGGPARARKIKTEYKRRCQEKLPRKNVKIPELYDIPLELGDWEDSAVHAVLR